MCKICSIHTSITYNLIRIGVGVNCSTLGAVNTLGLWDCRNIFGFHKKSSRRMFSFPLLDTHPMLRFYSKFTPHGNPYKQQMYICCLLFCYYFLLLLSSNFGIRSAQLLQYTYNDFLLHSRTVICRYCNNNILGSPLFRS